MNIYDKHLLKENRGWVAVGSFFKILSSASVSLYFLYPLLFLCVLEARLLQERDKKENKWP